MFTRQSNLSKSLSAFAHSTISRGTQYKNLSVGFVNLNYSLPKRCDSGVSANPYKYRTYIFPPNILLPTINSLERACSTKFAIFFMNFFEHANSHFRSEEISLKTYSSFGIALSRMWAMFAATTHYINTSIVNANSLGTSVVFG